MLYRSDSVDYRAQGPDMDCGVEAGSDMTPPTPAFPISPPTPYGKYSMFTCADFASICDQVSLLSPAFLGLTKRLVLVYFVFSVKNISELNHLRQTPSPSMQSYGGYRTDHGRIEQTRLSHKAIMKMFCLE